MYRKFIFYFGYFIRSFFVGDCADLWTYIPDESYTQPRWRYFLSSRGLFVTEINMLSTSLANSSAYWRSLLLMPFHWYFGVMRNDPSSRVWGYAVGNIRIHHSITWSTRAITNCCIFSITSSGGRGRIYPASSCSDRISRIRELSQSLARSISTLYDSWYQSGGCSGSDIFLKKSRINIFRNIERSSENAKFFWWIFMSLIKSHSPFNLSYTNFRCY